VAAIAHIALYNIVFFEVEIVVELYAVLEVGSHVQLTLLSSSVADRDLWVAGRLYRDY